ncbi:MAG: cobalamin-dependent protein [bacterium]|nr:MAG: cobalamin-dependent protein [bacterium]
MKVLLIQPPSHNDLVDRIFLHEPLALECVGAGLVDDGHRVVLLDARLEPDIEGLFTGLAPDIVGLTGFTSHVTIIRDIAKRLKRLRPETLVVTGGHHATVCPEDFNIPEIDLVVVGEGVQAMREIALCHGEGAGFDGIEGLAFPGSSGMTFTGPRAHPALDDLPFPDRTLTKRYREYYFNEWLRPMASIRTSLGCTSRCDFCSLWSITGGHYLRRSAASVVAEMSTIAEPNVFFCDDESMCDVHRMDELADAIREAGIRKKYFLYARADTVVRHPELFAKWRDIGLAQVFVGMETFSDARLESMNKEMTVVQQMQAARILERLNVLLYANFMVDPDYTQADFKELKRHVRALGLRYAAFSVLTPLPGSELYERKKQELLSRDPEMVDMLHAITPTALPLKEFYRRFYNLYVSALPARVTLTEGLRRFGVRGMVEQLALLGRFRKLLSEAHRQYS